jgi:V8-like Glu-specific endopeptidase
MLPRFSALLALALLNPLACGSSEVPLDQFSQRTDAIVGGYPDEPEENDAVVVVRATDAEGLCTGTLIAPNVVLTARHCVSKTTEFVDCVDDVTVDIPAQDLSIRRGFNMFSFISRGKHLVHDHSTNLCGHDIALIVLEQDDVTTSPVLATIQPVPVRVHKGPEIGELFTAVGYGLRDPGDINTAGQRYRRDGVRVTGFAPKTGEADFEGTQSICQGDSGGPAISAQGAVFGVTSRGLSCLGNANVWTRTDRFKWLIDEAITLAGTTYTGEDGTVYDGTPDGSSPIIPCPDGTCPAGLQCVGGLQGQYCTRACDDTKPCLRGEVCSQGFCFMNDACVVQDDCAAGTVCVEDNGKYCAPTCGTNTPCPSGFACTPELGVCFKSAGTGSLYDGTGSDSGCGIVHPRPSGTGAFWIALLGAALLATRRHRKGVGPRHPFC